MLGLRRVKVEHCCPGRNSSENKLVYPEQRYNLLVRIQRHDSPELYMSLSRMNSNVNKSTRLNFTGLIGAVTAYDYCRSANTDKSNEPSRVLLLDMAFLNTVVGTICI